MLPFMCAGTCDLASSAAMLVSDSHTILRLCDDTGLDCFCVNNGCPNDALIPKATRLLCTWWSSSSQAMIQEELLPLYLLLAMQWEDAQIVYPVTDKRQISPKVGRQGWIVGAPTSFLKPTIGQAATSWKILPVVLCALVSTMINSAPFPTPSCHLQSAVFKYPT